MEKVVLEREDAVHWIYRGEGAVNLVLAYTGSSSLFVGKVLRIQKVPGGRSKCVEASGLSVHECLLWKDANVLASSPARDVAEKLFVENIIIPLLGSQHVDAGMRVRVSRGFLKSIELNVHSQRPAWRVEAAEINVLCDSALLMSDHSVVPRDGIMDAQNAKDILDIAEHMPLLEQLNQNFKPKCCSKHLQLLLSPKAGCMEPKCGFLPFSRFITDGNAVKRNITRFRMHQFLKFDQKEVSQISDYDPLDLFSQSKDRVRKAIKALFATPQNNLRVFLNGSLVYGGLGGGADTTNSVSGEAFESALMHVIQAEVGLRTINFMELVSEAVFRSQVLDLLLEVQKLDCFDIEGAIHAYYNVVSQPCMVCRDLGEDQPSDQYAALHSIPLDESLRIVRDYLIAATAKDCSLMISFRPREDGIQGSSDFNLYLESTSQSFDYKANFIDLDMKPFKKMQHYYELDQKIVCCYIQKAKAQHEQAAASIELYTDNHFDSTEDNTTHVVGNNLSEL